MVRRAVIVGLTETESADYGERSGEEVITLASDRGQDLEGHNLYRCALNHASIADLVTTSIRKPEDQPCKTVTKCSTWNISSLIDPGENYLRRFLPVSTWNPERQNHEIRSWFGIGEVCMVKMPMQMIVAILGPMNGGRRHGFWSKGLLHPQKKSLRFRLSRKAHVKIEGFKESWIPVYKEEHDEISRDKWLEAMNEDGVLPDSLFIVNIPVPGELELQRIRDMAARKMDVIARLTELPEKQLSTCHSPLGNCPFVSCCWAQPEVNPCVDGGFNSINPGKITV